MKIHEYYKTDDGMMVLLHAMREASRHRPPRHDQSREAFIQDLVDNYGEFTRGDLQATVEAYCMQTGENSDAILMEIEDRVDAELHEITQDWGWR